MTEARRRFVRGPGWGTDHLSSDAVVAFVDGELAAGAHERATAHVRECLECTAEVRVQRQVRTRLRGADDPTVPSSLLAALQSIPHDAELPPSPPGLAMTADGTLVSVLRPERMPDVVRPAVSVRRPFGPTLPDAPAGLPDGLPDRSDEHPQAGRVRRLRVGAVGAVSGLALGALALGAVPSAGVVHTGVPAPRGVLGGAVLGGAGGVVPAARLQGTQGATSRAVSTPSASATPTAAPILPAELRQDERAAVPASFPPAGLR
ncbi:MAG: hypothetical protein JWP64_2033 [Pseudonocardia sp.]|jgi:hypothetical protein|uniref:anti-sigma factor family protein n=1 Tax=Pseudonocardia sp. TaxID=60912 RepID=UPI0026042335|nr:hypothetical protein [Pseudonocardia sp.]MCU1627084.1 hypothetical protein [Pseudonocardia sp.]MDT7698164.1 hypothetical protein [Pseudonocardiales bacterium]